MKLFIIFVTLILSIGIKFQTLISQESEETTKKIEKKWGMKEEVEVPVKKDFSTVNPVPDFLTQFQPSKQEFQVNPRMENTILGKFGTKVILPANSISLPSNFRKGDILTLELIEIYNDLDFITSGINMEFHNPNPNIFESGGMFRLSATYYDKPLNLKRGVKLQVEIPRLIYSDKKMKMYKFDERVGWVEKGELTTLNTTESSNPEIRTNFLFKFMDDFKWWNCDYPNPNTTCLEGNVIPVEANPPYSITIVGLDYKNAATIYADNLNFQVNAIKGKRVKLIAMDAKGNIGLSTELNTGSLDAFLVKGEKGKCTNIGTIKIEKIQRDILKDRKKLLSHLGLYDIIAP